MESDKDLSIKILFATIYFIVPTIVYNDWLDFNVPICDLADWHY